MSINDSSSSTKSTYCDWPRLSKSTSRAPIRQNSTIEATREISHPDSALDSLSITASPFRQQDNSNGLILPRFTLFPLLPNEIRLHIWQYAVLGLTARTIPIRERSLARCQNITVAPTKFTSCRPHPTLATVNREARDVVLSTHKRLFVPGNPHDFVTANLDKDILLIYTELETHTVTNLRKALGEERGEHLHLAVQAEVQLRPVPFPNPHPWVLKPDLNICHVAKQEFPELCYILVCPMRNVTLQGAHRITGEICFSSELRFKGDVQEYYEYASGIYYSSKKNWLEGQRGNPHRPFPLLPEIHFARLAGQHFGYEQRLAKRNEQREKWDKEHSNRFGKKRCSHPKCGRIGFCGRSKGGNS
jgi:hypothetical protein